MNFYENKNENIFLFLSFLCFRVSRLMAIADSELFSQLYQPIQSSLVNNQNIVDYIAEGEELGKKLVQEVTASGGFMDTLLNVINKGSIKKVSNLIQQGAYVDMVGEEGRTALDYFCWSRRKKALHIFGRPFREVPLGIGKIILENGADVNRLNRHHLSYFEVLNLLSCMEGFRYDLERFKLLLDHGDEPNRLLKDRNTLLHKVLNNLEFREDAGKRLGLTNTENSIILFKLLLDKGASVSIKSNKGDTVLDRA